MTNNILDTNVNSAKLVSHFLTIGEYHFSSEPCKITTILGSCVTVTMFDSMTSTGGMSHGLLPKCQNYGKCDKEYDSCFRYVECSIWSMLGEFESKAIPRKRLVVKLFGGASIVTSKITSAGSFQVGKRNVDAAIKAIKEAGLNLVAYDFGGEESRKITFRTDTGEVKLKREGFPEAVYF